ncbi:hypothetical protein [Prosthecobacter sp.]|uniref:hypothetical protein n=1 Tax=Prosthecobacter sp. TaxID=1965333 RepID=UPI0037836439
MRSIIGAFLLAASVQAAEEHTVFLLEADGDKAAMVDRTGRFAPEVRGGVVVKDERFGACLKFDGGGDGGITLKDDGRIRFDGGMTLDAWVRFDETPPDKGAVFALKVGSFDWELVKGKLNTAWMVFPTEEVFTTAPQQFKYFPVGGDTINGLMEVPAGQWTRLTASYDEALGVVTTLIDGLVDRRRYRYRGPQPLLCDGKSALTLLKGFKNCRVASIKLTEGTPDVTVPTMEAYLNALPYRGKMMITLDHIDTRLALPIDVTLVSEKASGAATTLKKITLDTHARQDLEFEAPTWMNSLHTCTVLAASGGRQFFARTLRLGNVKPAGRTMIHEDHTLSHGGRKFFPLLIYHAMPEDFPLMAELGFNVVLNDFNLNRAHAGDREGYARKLSECLDAAAKSKLFMIASANEAFGKLFTIPVAKDHPALLLWYGDDEPWGDITRLHESYNTIKMLAPDQPVLIVQNNYSRLQDTAPAADILATDPYPVPNVSLRAVADATQSSIRAVAGRKPVWTVLPQYGAKIPTREELRCMVWLALSSGANGLGLFAWDERSKDAKTGELKGWFTKEHPEQIEDLRAVLKEVHAMEPMLLTPDAVQQPAPRNPAIHALLKEGGGKRWLIVANDSRRAEDAILNVEGAANAEAHELTDGHASVRFNQDELRLKLPPLGVAVYELKP